MNEEIHINNENLKAQILSDLPLKYRPIRKSDLESLRKLSIHYTDLNDLQFLKYCKKLKYLSFLQMDTSLRPFHTLPVLPELKMLSITYVDIPDLEFLSNCPNLQRLDLAGIGTVDISPVNHLINLKSLEIADTNLAGCEKIDKIETLEYLALHHLNIQHFPFHQFPNVKEFNCHEVKVDDITQCFG